MSTPSYLTDTARTLIYDMRARKDYAALPILADALQDGDYDDEKVLEYFRTRTYKHNEVELQRTLCLILGGEYAASVHWLDAMAVEFELTYAVIMDAAQHLIDGKDWPSTYSPENEHKFMGREEEFWNHHEVITGQSFSIKQICIFDCAC